ncbi:MAG: hypothetical protein JO197_12465 [Acidobacteria bacterium]|nr:hypothetical protein [Acidobacteriota bacterium]MBV9478318.1 hypothetical protein [Acidobacteriota bacterium]
MTERQRRILLVVAIAVALTRFLAVAHNLFDWDEGLFCGGVVEYDVANHHPHPPGYPLFIAAAKLVHLIGVPPFRSLQTIVVLGALALFPATFFFARALGFAFATSVAGAAIYCFLPNVWIYGGTGFSDIPATAIGFAACALLLRGRGDRRAYILGAIVLGIAAGFRPPNLFIGAVPALVATWSRIRARDWRAVATALVLGGAIAGASYAGAALASSSIDGYLGALRSQSKWVHDIDSWHNPHRAPLSVVARMFFLWPVEQHAQMFGLVCLAIIGLLGALFAANSRRAALLVVATFVPLAITTWLNLDVQAAGRYAIPYLVVHALLAAEGLRWITLQRTGVQAALAGAIVIVFCVWTWPALTLQRRRDAPPVAALNWIRRNVPRDAKVYVHGGLGPLADVVLHDRLPMYFDSLDQISLTNGDAWVVDLNIAPGAHNFVWPRQQLWKILRRRNFEASISRLSAHLVFGSGFYPQEGSGLDIFQWMGKEGRIEMPAFHGDGRLHLRTYVPINTLPAHPTIEVWMNGKLLDRFLGDRDEIDRSWIVPSRAGAPNELRITTSGVVNPKALGKSDDARDLGLRIDVLSWTPVR